MARTRDWLFLSWRGGPLLDKPPLSLWGMAVGHLVWGFNEFAARAWQAALSVAIVAVTYAAARFWLPVRGATATLISRPSSRVVYVSSTAVYGVPRKHPIEETDSLDGVGPYRASKILAERACEEFRRQGYTVPVIRPKTFIGPARLGVFAILYDWVYSGARIPILGRGTNRYQLLDVRDLCQAIELLTTGGASDVNATFNVGAERFCTWRTEPSTQAPGRG